jgi:hypothetical protein
MWRMTWQALSIRPYKAGTSGSGTLAVKFGPFGSFVEEGRCSLTPG